MDASRRSKGARVAAGSVCAVFAAFVLIHLLWAVGITWGLEEVSGGEGEFDASLSLTVVSLAAAGACAAVIIVTLAWPAIGTMNPATTWAQRTVTLPLAIAALVVARAHPRPHAGDAARPPVTRAPVAH